MTRKTVRRSNLLFFGIPDASDEAWTRSESHVISVCSKELDITISENAIERAHRLGRFKPGKNRPIIAAFANFKDKTNILSATPKLKNSAYSIREDYSARVRLARQKLYNFAQEHGGKYKIRFDKLVMNEKQFFYDAESDSVLETKT